MRNMLLAAFGTAALLAGCGEASDKKADDIAATDAMTGEQVAAKVDGVKLKPGQWETSFTIEDLEMAQMPGGASAAQFKEQMKAGMSRVGIKHCVTPEQAARPSADMLAGQADKNCSYKGFDMAGGAVKGQVSCTRDGQTMNATMTGTYAPDRYDMVMDMTSTGTEPGATMKMKARTQGRLIGATCEGEPS